MSRLEQRVQRLEARTGKSGCAVIVVEVDESEEQALSRHYARHPEDRGREPLIIQLIDPTWRDPNEEPCR